jgi:hypothetical protein
LLVRGNDGGNGQQVKWASELCRLCLGLSKCSNAVNRRETRHADVQGQLNDSDSIGRRLGGPCRLVFSIKLGCCAEVGYLKKKNTSAKPALQSKKARVRWKVKQKGSQMESRGRGDDCLAVGCWARSREKQGTLLELPTVGWGAAGVESFQSVANRSDPHDGVVAKA